MLAERILDHYLDSLITSPSPRPYVLYAHLSKAADEMTDAEVLEIVAKLRAQRENFAAVEAKKNFPKEPKAPKASKSTGGIPGGELDFDKLFS